MAFQAIFAVVQAAVNFIFTSQTLLAATIRFVAGSVLTQLLSGQTKTEGPRLSDLKIQVSTYGNPIPRIYGEGVRIAGNVIDKSDLIETIKKKKKKMLGITMASQTTYTYTASLAIGIADGQLPERAIRKAFANGKVIYDRDAAVVEATDPAGGVYVPGLGRRFTRAVQKTQAKFKNITFYPGSATQTVDPLLQSLHPGQPVPAYRHTAYVVIEELALADYGNGIPNIEFEVETSYGTLRSAVEDIATFADVTINAWQLNRPLRGYVVAKSGPAWSAIEPLAGAFAFDLVAEGANFLAVPRGRQMRTVLAETDFAARPASERNPRDTARVKRQDANSFPDEVSVTFFDATRDYQPNTQQAFRNAGYSKNKVNVELPIVFDDATEPRNIAQRILSDSIASVSEIDISVSAKLGWLQAGNLVGLTIGGEVQPFRLISKTESPNGVFVYAAVYEDVLSHDPTAIIGTSGLMPANGLEFPGNTIVQLIDGSIVEDADDDTGFYVATCGTGSAWVGGDIDRAEGTGSPLTYEPITDIVIEATIADCQTTLPSGTTDVYDGLSSLEVLLLGGDAPQSATLADVLVRNVNLAWVGPQNGQGGEYINFTTVVAGGSPNTYTLSGFLRGRRGTEHAVATHAAGERFVIMNTAEVGRLDFGAPDWNVDRTYRSTSVDQDDVNGLVQVFQCTGEGKRPYSPVHLLAVRNDANADVLLKWTRRSRYEAPRLGGGPTPLGEPTETYSLDLYNTAGTTIVRSVTVTGEAQYNYTAALQTADGKTPGAAVKFDVYQFSDVRGKGHVATGIV